jgi:hypothetical protein
VALAPSHLRALLDAGEHAMARLSSVKTVTASGSQLQPELIRGFAAALPGVTLVNQYGASEVGPCLLGVASPAAPPSGFPVEGYAVHVLDTQMQAVKNGDAGEIVVEGPWLARGYLNRPDLTAERFIRNPFDAGSGERCFRTGDLGRRLPDGSIEVLGRADEKFNIRGFLVDPGEIECALREYPGIREAAVIAVEVAREMRLVAFLVPDPGVAVSPHQLRRFLAHRIPAHKIPAAFLPLAGFPLTASGKVDRRALSHPPFFAPQGAGEEPVDLPVTSSEIQLAQIWEEVFGLGRISRSAHFFDLGGDSLTAMVVGARVHSECGVALDMRAFAAHPVFSDFAAEVDRLRGSSELNGFPPITPVPLDEPCPLSFAQEAIWNHIGDRPQNANDFVKGCAYRLSGSLDVKALEAAIHWVAARHSILRTVIAIVNGSPAQVVSGSAPECLAFEDLSSLPDPGARASKMLAEESARPFDLANGPLIRQRLVKIGPSEHWLLQAHHHIMSDRWSWTLYVEELGLAYKAVAAGSPPPRLSTVLQYRDYAAWERRVLSPGTPLRARIVDWWRQQAAGRPRDEPLPLGRRFPFGKPLMTGATRRRNLGPELASRMETFSAREGATYFAIALAVFAALLTELKRSASITIGVYIFNRWHPGFQNVLGNFTSLVPVCLHCDHRRPFREWLLSVRETLANAQAHAQLPTAQLEHDLLEGGTWPPIVHAIIIGPVPDRPISFGALKFAFIPEPIAISMPWGFSIILSSLGEHQPHIDLEFDARLYDPAKAHRLFDRFHQLLDGIASDSNVTVAELLKRC